jgi:hypothetical protein
VAKLPNTFKIDMEDKRFKTTLNPVTLENANEAQKPQLEKSLKETNMIPNMYANMVNSPGLMETYATGYDLSGETVVSAR